MHDPERAAQRRALQSKGADVGNRLRALRARRAKLTTPAELEQWRVDLVGQMRDGELPIESGKSLIWATSQLGVAGGSAKAKVALLVVQAKQVAEQLQAEGIDVSASTVLGEYAAMMDRARSIGSASGLMAEFAEESGRTLAEEFEVLARAGASTVGDVVEALQQMDQEILVDRARRALRG